jgi:hypothetical protein
MRKSIIEAEIGGMEIKWQDTAITAGNWNF